MNINYIQKAKELSEELREEIKYVERFGKWNIDNGFVTYPFEALTVQEVAKMYVEFNQF